jgi:hypothetical protein
VDFRSGPSAKTAINSLCITIAADRDGRYFRRVGAISLPTEDWAGVARRVARSDGPVRWAYAATRTADGAWELAFLSVLGDAAAEPRWLHYAEVAVGIEQLTSRAAGRRLRAGRAIPAGRLKGGLSFNPPGGRVNPTRITTDPTPQPYLMAGADWPEYLVNVTLVGPGSHANRLTDALHAAGLPFYPSVADAIGELVLGVSGEKLQRHTSPQVVIRLPDRRARLAEVTVEVSAVSVWVERGESETSELTLHAVWRREPEDATLQRAELPIADSGVYEVGTSVFPDEMTLALVASDGTMLDRQGWQRGMLGLRPEQIVALDARVARLAAQGEGQQVEYKQQLGGPSVNASFADTVAAFANGAGGTILIGVADDGTIVGYAQPKAADQIVSIVRDKIVEHPPFTVDATEVDSKPVVVVSVTPGPPIDGPYLASGRVMLRFGATTREARPSEIKALMAQPTAGWQLPRNRLR